MTREDLDDALQSLRLEMRIWYEEAKQAQEVLRNDVIQLWRDVQALDEKMQKKMLAKSCSSMASCRF